MHIVITGATGNAGTSLLHWLSADGAHRITGIARRRPQLRLPGVTWKTADVARDDLVTPFRGADAVVHLAWLIQPSRDEAVLRETNVLGSQRVFDAVAEADVPALVYASSIGAYSPGPKDAAVDESWPTGGIATNAYSRQKSEVERRLDRFERRHPGVRVVRLRKALLFKHDAASSVRRLFLGPLFPNVLAQPRLLRVVPDVDRLRAQAVHSLDAGRAYHLALLDQQASGAFNIAADPPLDARAVAAELHARTMRVPAAAARALVDVLWRLHIEPTPADWLDLARGVPIMDTSRARMQLGWAPATSAFDALLEMLNGIVDGGSMATPPLDARTGGVARWRELATGVGSRIGL